MADANLNSDSSENVPSPDQIETAGVQVTERDIVFDCPHCGGELVIDMDGAGMEVNCGLCGGALTVPEYDGPSLQFLQAATAKLAKAVQGARNADSEEISFRGALRVMS